MRSRVRDTSRRLVRSEDGTFSVLEVVIACTIMTVVALMGFKSVGTVAKVGWMTFDESYANRASALAVDEIRAEVVSGNIIFDPSTSFNPSGGYPTGEDCATQVAYTSGAVNCAGSGIMPGFSLLVYTQTNSLYQCVQWRLVETGSDAGSLEVRQWANPWSTGDSVPKWQILLTGLTNTSSEPPFALDSGSNYGTPGRLLDVDLYFDQGTSASPVHVQTSIAGRDAWYYPPDTGDCAPEPPPS
jgi:hypothetical protein